MRIAPKGKSKGKGKGKGKAKPMTKAVGKESQKGILMDVRDVGEEAIGPKSVTLRRTSLEILLRKSLRPERQRAGARVHWRT